MRVRFLKDWQGESSASFKKDDEAEINDSLAWDLATQGYVKFKKPIDPEIESAKQAAKDAAHHVIVPSSVDLAALGIISLAVKAWSDTGNTSSINSAFVERDRQYREDRKEIMGILMEMQGDIRRIQGKLEGTK